jgi:phthalate 4,5-dioxygenase oxygenase subunit
MLSVEQNELLTQVGPATPLGIMMRRYWVPALLDWELPAPDCPPVRLKLLGEKLVAFRNTSGVVGVVQDACPHRRASLFWGRNEEDGLRCVYHGWKFDVSGQCTDMPSEPESSNFKDKITITAYPTAEMGNVVWVYMGPPEHQPALPELEFTQVSDSHRGISKVVQDCNWLQGLEGGIDSVHTNFLHRNLKGSGVTAMDSARSVSMVAEVEVRPTDYGYTYAGIRRMGGGEKYVRGYHFVLPWHQLRPLQMNRWDRPRINGHMWVPMDDTHTMVWNWTYTYGPLPLDPEEQAQRGSGNEIGRDIDPKTFRPTVGAFNDYGIDREVQKYDTYSGIPGTNTQDRALQESMGPVCEREMEHLGTTDRAIIVARKQLVDAIRVVRDGGAAPGTDTNTHRLRAYETTMADDASWVEMMSSNLYEMASTPGRNSS